MSVNYTTEDKKTLLHSIYTQETTQIKNKILINYLIKVKGIPAILMME